MAISLSLKQFLDVHQVSYDVVRHRRTSTAHASARTSHVSPRQLIKGVLLSDYYGYVVAAIPADQDVDLDWVEMKTGRRMRLADERKLSDIFLDCEEGAVPALGEAFGVSTLWDEQLHRDLDYYIEAGDHEELLHFHPSHYTNLLNGNNCAPIAH